VRAIPKFHPIFLSLAVVGVLAGCGGAGSSSSQRSPGPAATAAPNAGSAALTCDLVPASMVNAALGTDLGNPTQSAGAGAVACEFQGAKAGTVMIRIQKGDDAAAFATERKTFDTSGQPTQDYAGLGDEAYTSTKTMPLGLPDVTTLVAREGSVEILVSSSASTAAEQALEQQLFAKVG
jgi:hypothetical protein